MWEDSGIHLDGRGIMVNNTGFGTDPVEYITYLKSFFQSKGIMPSASQALGGIKGD